MPAEILDQPLESIQAPQDGDRSRVTSLVDFDPELLYCLQCSVELGEISPFDYVLFTHETPPARALQKLRDADQFWPAHWLRNTSRDYFEQLTLVEQYVVSLHSVQDLEFGLQALQERMAFVVQQKVLRDLGRIQDFPRLMKVHDPEITKAIPDKVFDSVAAVTRGQVQEFAHPVFADAIQRLEADIELTRQALLWASEPSARSQARAIARELLRVPHMRDVAPVRVEQLQPRAVIAAKRKKAHAAKGAIKKALKLLSCLGAEENTRLLVSGEEVRISHPDSPFRFLLKAHKAKGWLIDRTVKPGGHVPYQLTLQTKGGLTLASLCVIFKDTPVLDQLLALTMFVQTGGELELLEKANWFGIADQAMVVQYLEAHSPALVSKVRRPPIEAMLRADDDRQAFWDPYQGPVNSWLGEALSPAREMLSRIQLALSTPAPPALA